MTERLEGFAAKLGDQSLGMVPPDVTEWRMLIRYWLEPRQKLSVAVELRDNVEMLCTPNLYPTFLKFLLPIFIKILEGPPAFTSTDLVQVWSTLSDIRILLTLIALAAHHPRHHPPPTHVAGRHA